MIKNLQMGFEKRFEVPSPCLLQEEDAQTFFSKMSSEKQTHCRPLCLPLVFLAQTEVVRKCFFKKTNTTLLLQDANILSTFIYELLSTYENKRGVTNNKKFSN
ncbi:hypothetical protein HanIR_Chr01g0044571 [Helianthus annuus]|nr:hypothetical protein HanIR_Chr01g0044571 [Helianthus annuus]